MWTLCVDVVSTRLEVGLSSVENLGEHIRAGCHQGSHLKWLDMTSHLAPAVGIYNKNKSTNIKKTVDTPLYINLINK